MIDLPDTKFSSTFRCLSEGNWYYLNQIYKLYNITEKCTAGSPRTIHCISCNVYSAAVFLSEINVPEFVQFVYVNIKKYAQGTDVFIKAKN